MALATLDELAARLGRTFQTGTPDAARAEATLDDVSVFAQSVAGNSDWTVDGANDSPQVPEEVRRIILAASRRAFQNPEGYRMKQAGQFHVEMDDGFGANLFTQWEDDILRSYNASGGLGTISMTRGDDAVDLGWLTVAEAGYNASPIPYVPGWETI